MLFHEVKKAEPVINITGINNNPPQPKVAPIAALVLMPFNINCLADQE